MIEFICNHCKKPIDLEKAYCAHIKISCGEEAIRTRGKYVGEDADLCAECFYKLYPLINGRYQGGNEHLLDHPTEKGGVE